MKRTRTLMSLMVAVMVILMGTPTLRAQVATPDRATIPLVPAPLGLGDVALPDDPGSVEALFRRLPDTVAGQPANPRQHGPDRKQASYGLETPPFGAPLQLGAISLDDSDFFPPSFTPGDYVASASQTEPGGTTVFGRDGTLVWIGGETTAGTAGGPDGTPAASTQVYTLVWGAVDGSWLFTAAARTPDDRDALVEAFVAAARDHAGTPAPRATPNAIRLLGPVAHSS